MSSSTRIPTRPWPEPGPEPEPESFRRFFETWLLEQERDVEELKAVVKAYTESTKSTQSETQSTQSIQSETESTQYIIELVSRVMGHYETYYQVKSESADQNVLGVLNPSWRSNLEESFFWIGGWRPSTAFHLLYSVTGLHMEAGLSELLTGLSTGDMGDLSLSQLRRIDELQRQTVREERKLTENLAALQETVADKSMVELSHMATELLRNQNSVNLGRGGTELVSERVGSTIGTKEDELKEILGRADDLRLRTLRNVVDILSPIQAVYFLIAAAELHLRVHEWGMEKDASVHPLQH